MCSGKNDYVYEGLKKKWTVCESFIILKEKGDKK